MVFRVSQKKFTPLVSYEIKSLRPIFKIEMLTYQLKSNLGEKILFVKGDLKRKFLLMQMYSTFE